jgi:hypothetical protein
VRPAQADCGESADRPEALAQISRSEFLDAGVTVANERTVVAVQGGVVTGDHDVRELGEDPRLRAERRVDHLGDTSAVRAISVIDVAP